MAATFQRFDSTLVKSEHLSFEDKGYVAKGRKTRRIAVISRYDHSLIGYVKYFNHWRQYTLFPLNCVLNKDCLREVADFCEEASLAHREGRIPFPASVEKQVVEVGATASSL